MDQTASLSAPARRIRRIVLAGPAILAVLFVAFYVQRPLHRRGGWQPWVFTFNGVVFLALAGLVPAALGVWALARRRRAAGTAPGWAWRRSLAEVGMVYGTLPWVWMILLPGERAGDASRQRVSLVPLRDLFEIVAAGPLGATLQIGGNLLVFAALGFFGPMRFARLASAWRALALGAACSVLVETAQYVFELDRVSSVDDVLVNAAGAGLAALASRRWWRDADAKSTGADAGEPSRVRSGSA
ncbi:VanZ family protein [Kitasatospora sp. NPDC049285]|uniref:VanZ family protein n=1 Tax=Kitasatospora sp. NPDC049285 TaxID=3157096 RepID=UPI00341F12F6